MISTQRHSEDRALGGDWLRDFRINKLILFNRPNIYKMKKVPPSAWQKLFLTFLLGQVLKNITFEDSLWLQRYWGYFYDCGVDYILVMEELDVRLCVNINQCISLVPALSGSPGLWLINELFSTLSSLLLTTYHQPHNLTNILPLSPANTQQLTTFKHFLQRLAQHYLLEKRLSSITFYFEQIEAYQFNNICNPNFKVGHISWILLYKINWKTLIEKKTGSYMDQSMVSI